ncbi:MAG: isochorismatase family protein [Burkholderiaceae bacterium]|nr:isochorismatase family protein [Burkholderiaceae bacterium]
MPEIRRRYESAGLGNALTPGRRPAVLVVDLIHGFTDPSFPAGSNQDEVIHSTRELLDLARAAAVPVIFTTIAFPASRLNSTVWLQKMPAMRGLVEGSRWTEVDDRLGPTPQEPVVTKRSASAFTNTDLGTLLVSLDVDSLIVCGATTSGCVRATVVDGCMAGYRVFVPRECVGDRAQGPHEANLFDIDAKYGDVIDLRRACELVRPDQLLKERN